MPLDQPRGVRAMSTAAATADTPAATVSPAISQMAVGGGGGIATMF
eukprot:COSAG01_NODE_3570_length_5924_cov_4.911588_7_plen_46_part_00